MVLIYFLTEVLLTEVLRVPQDTDGMPKWTTEKKLIKGLFIKVWAGLGKSTRNCAVL